MRFDILFITSFLFLFSNGISSQNKNKLHQTLTISDATIDFESVEIVGSKYAKLKHSSEEHSFSDISEPNMQFVLNLSSPGRYLLSSYVKRTEIPTGVVDNIYMSMQFGNNRITRRIVSDARNYNFHILGEFYITNQDTVLKLWLPKGIQFEKIEINQYQPVAAPKVAQEYEPIVKPPKSHPRLWITRDFLPIIKSRLNTDENISAWNEVKKTAKEEYTFSFSPLQEMFYSTELEKVVETKAFYYLMTSNNKIGREAVDLMLNYLSVLEYGNVTYGDITRNIGHTIYISSLVYDWCNNLLTINEKESFYKSMLTLARKMEIGWPPFKENIVNGHAAEAQVNRDLLAMSIAIYDRDPEPYKYTSYRIFEELIPMRRFEYESPRHNQGIDYGAYRHMWEMNAAWLLYRMTGVQHFDENIKNLPLYWLYMRLPNGKLFRDGDVFRVRSKHPYYWKQPEMFLLDYSYSNNNLLKGEFFKQGGLPNNPILFLLLNDPDLKPTLDYNKLPPALETGEIIGSLICRTGWDISPSSNDVVAEIKGGGYHFGNHQHSDAGSFQIYHHGLQVCNIGIYAAYGTSYDFNFNKRSISHSTMLVKDPKERFGNNLLNDGGARFNQRTPSSPQNVKEDSWFDYGKNISSKIEFNNQKLLYGYYKVDLTKAYSEKLSNYTRTFCFVNTEREDIPAFVILLDDITSSNKDFKKFWKINTLNKPLINESEIILHNKDENNIVGKTYLKTLLPKPSNKEVVFWNSQDTCNLITNIPKIKVTEPEANGFEIVITPKDSCKRDVFLNVFLMTSNADYFTNPNYTEKDDKYFIEVLDYYIVMPSNNKQIEKSFDFIIDNNIEKDIIITGLKEGLWTLYYDKKDSEWNFEIEQSKNSYHFKGRDGRYRLIYKLK